ALGRMEAAGHPLKIALFLDTSIMNDEDLTTPRGKQIFYASIRDYYSRIPPKYWATIDGKPIVWLYDAQHVAAFDQSTFDYVYQQFPQDFGGLTPYIVREYQWYQAKNAGSDAVLKTDGFYGWGAAPSGFNTDPRFGVAEIGPGFNNTGFCHAGAAQNCFDVNRQNGAYYAQQWQEALRAGHKLVAIETWNEFSEGSGIAESVQYGRLYIDLTRKYADAFHAGRTSAG
ncbi:MAG TPA: DUF5010 domain-containing protein, partial [Chloroflexota bacterium]|nr:DUF5010 domain-containing protein [Chloroflexota bacterium]